MQTQIYLFFDGRLDEALEFYKKTLGIEVEMLMRFKDHPRSGKQPGGQLPVPARKMKRHAFVLQARRPARDGLRRLRARAIPNSRALRFSLAVKTEAEADKLFAALAARAARWRMPLGKTFFSPKFGMVQDKFGVSWMVMVSNSVA